MRPKLAAVSGDSVQAVVGSLGDREEVRVAVEHEPIRIDSHTACVADQRLQHLCDAATCRSGVDVDDPPSVELLPRFPRDELEALDPVSTDERLEPAWIELLDLDLHVLIIRVGINSISGGISSEVSTTLRADGRTRGA